MDLLHQVSWVLFDTINSILEEKKLLYVLGLFLALVEHLYGCGQALFALFDTDFFVDWKQDHDEYLAILCRYLTFFLKSFDLVNDLVFTPDPLKSSRFHELPVKHHNRDSWLENRDGIKKPKFNVTKLMLIGVLFKHASKSVLLLFVE